jgi:predicted XRE-type DNA-binding protein
MKRKAKIRVEEGSGNVFADLGFAYPEGELLKAKLTLQIYRLIEERGLTQVRAGKILGIKQPHVSSLMRGRSGTFSVERLMKFLTNLGQDVKIIVESAGKEQGEMSIARKIRTTRSQEDKEIGSGLAPLGNRQAETSSPVVILGESEATGAEVRIQSQMTPFQVGIIQAHGVQKFYDAHFVGTA